MSDNRNEIETTGHVWDEDVREFNNPLPRWWLWSFYATIIFAIIYWVYYPTWPIGKTFTSGVAKIEVNGESRSWNTRNLLEKQLSESPAAQARAASFAKISSMSLADISKDPEMSAFTLSVGRTLFGDNCAACHGQGAQGVSGHYPSLVDDSWIWGATDENILKTITDGRIPVMTPFEGVLSDSEIMNVAHYVLSLSGEEAPADSVALGDALFHGKGTCFACHGADAKGMAALGSPNLTDQIWETFDFTAANTPQEKLDLVESRIRHGVPSGSRQMPAWGGRLSADEIKVLTSYIHQLGGNE